MGRVDAQRTFALISWLRGGSLPFDAGSFDTVLCTEVLEHVAEPFRAVNEIARVLRPAGHVILTVPLYFPLHEEAGMNFFRYTPYGLRHLLKAQVWRSYRCDPLLPGFASLQRQLILF